MNLPKDMDGAKFAYQKKDTDCIFAYLQSTKESSLKSGYKQTSFATRVFTKDKDQLDASWYVYKETLPENFEFQWSGRQSINGEVRINPYPFFYNQKGAFVLFSKREETVSDSCDVDIDSMLGSIASKYENIDINSRSNGRAFIDSANNKPTYLKFIPDDDNITKIVRELNFTQNSSPTVHNGQLHLIHEGSLIKTDIASGSIKNVLDKTAEEEDVVNQYYFSGDRVFYLYGKFCQEYLAKCDLSLYEYDASKKESTLLTSNLPYRNILGYDEEKNILYMAHIEGDAGCFKEQAGGYDFSKKKIVEKQDFSGCQEDTEALEKLNASRNMFKNQSVSYDYIKIENGKIVMPKTEMKTPGNRWNIRYIK